MKSKTDLAKDSDQLFIFASKLAVVRQNKLQNLRVTLINIRFDLITVIFVLVLVTLSEPSFHLSRGRDKLGSTSVARTELRKLKANP